MRFTQSCLCMLSASVLLITGCRSDSSAVSTAPRQGSFWSSTESKAQAARSDWPSRNSDLERQWFSQVYPTGRLTSSVIGVEKGIPTEVRLNYPFDYTLIVSNLTADPLHQVKVYDAVNEGLTILKSSPDGVMVDGRKMLWLIGTLPPGESRIIEITGQAETTGPLMSCATVSYERQLCTAFNVVQPKLEVTLTGPTEAIVCDELEYTFEVANSGTGTIRNVLLSEPLPDGLTTLDGGSTLHFEIDTLSAGESRPYRVLLKAAQTGQFTVKGSAVGDGDLSAVSPSVQTVINEPVLNISTSGPELRFLGRSAEFDIVITNMGEGVARNTIVEETLPRGTMLISASHGGQRLGDVVRWHLGDLEPSENLTLTVQINTNEIGPLSRSVVARADCAADVHTGSTTMYRGIPAIMLEVVDILDPVQVGEETVYRIRVTNQGSAPGTNIRITCELEDNTQYLFTTGSTPGTLNDRTLVLEPLTTLAPQDQAEWLITVEAISVGDVRFKVSMISDQLTRPVEETEATNIYD